MQGFINVYKPVGMTSATVVSILKRKLHVDKIGHMGTLDPLAQGVLPIAMGKATRLFDMALYKRKTYIAEFTFGVDTDTLDITGKVIDTSDIIPSVDDIRQACDKLVGKISQIPPAYSAKKINGKCAYKLARQGASFDLKAKEVTIFKFDFLQKIDENKFKFEIECSSGTYIRALARDLGKLLNTYGIMSALTRVQTGNFYLKDSVNVDSVAEKDIMGIDCAFPDFDRIDVSSEQYKKLINGVGVLIDKPLLKNTFVYYDNQLLGLTKAKSNFIKLDIFLKE